jgi:hypothetical protein
MKLDRFSSAAVTSAMIALLAGLTAFGSGCSATTAHAPQTASSTSSASIANVAGTTSLMSAELPAPAPKVGKSHLVVDGAADFDVDSMNSDESAPKEARRSDGSHRSGSFGMSSK